MAFFQWLTRPGDPSRALLLQQSDSVRLCAGRDEWIGPVSVPAGVLAVRLTLVSRESERRSSEIIGRAGVAGDSGVCFSEAEHESNIRSLPLNNGTASATKTLRFRIAIQQREWINMGKGILLWLLGIPLPIIILLLLFWH
jgi:hypothetical protein